MKNILAVAAMAILTGCNTTSFQQTMKDGSSITVKNTRSMWSTDAYTCTLSTNGTASLTANKSSVDSQAVAAIAQGISQGLMAAKP